LCEMCYNRLMSELPLDEYEQIPPQSVLASKWLADLWKQLGSPTTPLSPSGQKLMKVIISVWEDLYSKDAHEWYEERKDYQKSEMSISEQVSKKTGRSLASFPTPIFLMMKRVFPDFKVADRKNCIKIVRLWPMFRFANRV
jgi:hypothetical protein